MADPEIDLYPARWWHKLPDGRIQWDLCPRDCRLNDGQRGACFVRMGAGEQMVLPTYCRSSGFSRIGRLGIVIVGSGKNTKKGQVGDEPRRRSACASLDGEGGIGTEDWASR